MRWGNFFQAYCASTLAIMLGEAIVSALTPVCFVSFSLAMIIVLCSLFMGRVKAASAAQSEGAHVLIVDDDLMNRKIFTHLLQKTKCQAAAVASGQECLDLVQKEHFDIIFMDLLMPEMDGIETLRRLKSLEGNLCKDTPIIALTANALGDSREEYISRGFDDFLSKPIVGEKLEALIRQILMTDAQVVPEINSAGSAESTEPVNENEIEITLPEIEGVDWDYATQNIQDKTLLLRMLKIYYQSISSEHEAISNLATMIGETDEAINNYRIHVHSIKNTSAQLGIMSVATLAKLLEAAARDGKIEKIRVRNPFLLDELMKMKERIAPAIEDEVNESSKEMANFSRISDSLDTLRFYLSQMDINNAFQVIDQIKSYAYSPDLQERLDQLAQKVSGLKFDEALKEIAKLTERFSETDANEALFL